MTRSVLAEAAAARAKHFGTTKLREADFNPKTENALAFSETKNRGI